jgi:hypothetical protein
MACVGDFVTCCTPPGFSGPICTEAARCM